ncbi:hypothetical protein Leryth_001929 [Lithospermum erythrorhizon]|nr:hypothetical protein Leryth_001929 [Lithospermum erythrorhizon]KAG9141500.1 hypothetical protein Leryth_001929 [Lithospermum erythrorhizon]
MAWFSSNISLGNFPDLAGAVNKLQESVKNIEKNFDSALGLEENKSERSSASEASGLWPPAISFAGEKGEGGTTESLGTSDSFQETSPVEESEDITESLGTSELFKQPSLVEEHEAVENDEASGSLDKERISTEKSVEESEKAELQSDNRDERDCSSEGQTVDIAPVDETAVESHANSPTFPVEAPKPHTVLVEETETSDEIQKKKSEEATSPENPESIEVETTNIEDESAPPDTATLSLQERSDEHMNQEKELDEVVVSVNDPETAADDPARSPERPGSDTTSPKEIESSEELSESSLLTVNNVAEFPKVVPDSVELATNAIVEASEGNILQLVNDNNSDTKERLSLSSNSSEIADSVSEVEKVKKDMKMMEAALQGAARQAQAKADEIAKLMNENEQLKGVVEDLRRKSSEADVETLREEYHQRVSTLERKVYALTRERDTLRREQNRRSDASALLKEKDEIINQIMAEGEALSKKQASQEGQIRKLRAQVRELEEEKKGLLTKLQVEENKVESIKKDKAETENLLQETIEKHQGELASQKEYYTDALNAAKEAEALAEARVNFEARNELEGRLREAQEREAMLVQTLEELRQTLSRKEQQAAFREDMLRKDIEDLQKRYQASERRCEELITQVPESTRPLLRQIEAMQETAARRLEASAAVERSLTSRLQEAEAKAAAAEEKERSINERLSQTLSRINVLEAQISCLRAEQTQMTRSLEKERQKAAEHRQEYLALKEESETNEGRVSQLEGEMRELRRKHKEELHEALTRQELLQQEAEREKAARLDQERTARLQSSTSIQSPIAKQHSGFENGGLARKLSSASSLSSMEESYFLQASLDSSDSLYERRNLGEGGMSPYYMKSVTPNAFESALRQKEGELASYMSRLASMESIRDSLAEELVKMTAQCEKLRTEAAMLPSIRAELEALRRRHSAALELMGERDEELEELRADIVDLKEMYREQVNLLVNKIQVMSPSFGAS